jgi:ferredoxin, 2Fe-2S
MPLVTYVESGGDRHTVDVPLGENVMRGALANNIEGIVGECGGGLACATCHCYIDDAWTDVVGSPATDAERDMLECAAEPAQANSRLSCQITVSDALDGLVVRLPAAQY